MSTREDRALDPMRLEDVTFPVELTLRFTVNLDGFPSEVIFGDDDAPIIWDAPSPQECSPQLFRLLRLIQDQVVSNEGLDSLRRMAREELNRC